MAIDKRIFTKTTGKNRARPPSPRYTCGEGVQLICLDTYPVVDGNMPGSQAEAIDELKVTTGDSVVGMDASGGLAHGNHLRLAGTVQTTEARFRRVSFQEAAEGASGVAEGVDAGMGTSRRQNASRRGKNRVVEWLWSRDQAARDRALDDMLVWFFGQDGGGLRSELLRLGCTLGDLKCMFGGRELSEEGILWRALRKHT